MHHQPHERCCPIIIPSTITINITVVESLKLRELSHVAPDNNGVVIQGLSVGPVLDAVGRRSAPIDLPLFPHMTLASHVVEWELGVEDMMSLGSGGGGHSISNEMVVDVGRGGRMDAVVYWVDADKNQTYGHLLSCQPTTSSSSDDDDEDRKLPLTSGR